MSDIEDLDQSPEQPTEQTFELPKPIMKVRYKSSKGDADLRKQKSKINMAKAREAKLKKCKELKEAEKYQYEIPANYDNYTDSSSEEELFISRKPKKENIKKSTSSEDKRMERLEAMMNHLVKKVAEKPKRHPERKTVIQLQQPIHTQKQQSSPKLNRYENFKSKMIFDLQ